MNTEKAIENAIKILKIYSPVMFRVAGNENYSAVDAYKSRPVHDILIIKTFDLANNGEGEILRGALSIIAGREILRPANNSGQTKFVEITLTPELAKRLKEAVPMPQHSDYPHHNRVANSAKARGVAATVLEMYRPNMSLIPYGGNLIIKTEDFAVKGEATMLRGALSAVSRIEIQFTNMRSGSNSLQLTYGEVVSQSLGALGIRPEAYRHTRNI